MNEPDGLVEFVGQMAKTFLAGSKRDLRSAAFRYLPTNLFIRAMKLGLPYGDSALQIVMAATKLLYDASAFLNI